MSPTQVTRLGGRNEPESSERTVLVEDLHLRSYAHREGYDLRVEVVTPDGETAFQESYYLQPGAAKSEVDAVPPGEYEIRATLDGDRERTLRCRLGPDPDRTAVIEVGNGVLSLTEGLRVR